MPAPLVTLAGAGSLLLLALALAGPAHAAHEDSEWAGDRQTPYGGSGWTESQGGGPPLSFPSDGIALRSWLSLDELDATATGANDIWGYTAPSGREYAIVGLTSGTAIVEVSDPGDAQLVGVIAGPTSDWRDMRTYGDHLYAVSEGGGGIQVIDLANVDAGTVTLVATITTGGVLASHNVDVNEHSGRLYRAGGGSAPVQGFRIYDLADPAAPAFVGEWHDRYCHDVQVVTWTEAPFAGAEIVFCYANTASTGGSPSIEIVDVTTPASPSVVGSIALASPPIFGHPAVYSHQGWLSADRQYVYFNDEVDEAVHGNTTTTRIIDVSDLTSPTQVATFTNGNTARDHNLFVRGDRIFEANYRSGLRVFDATAPLAPVELAWFDTYPDDDDAHYNGLWGVYPFLPSGTVIGSDIEKGLFVWTLDEDVPSGGAIPGLVGALLLAGAGGRMLSRRPRRGPRA